MKQHTNLDFYGVTEHEVTFEVSTGNDYLTDYRDSCSEEYKTLHDQSNAHNKDDEFVTIPGVELTWYDKAGHMNLYDTAWFPRTHPQGANENPWIKGGNRMYDLPAVYARITEDPRAIAQFNHPSASRSGNFFGFKHFNKKIDKHITLFEYRYSGNYPNIFADFVSALDKGWHVSPTYSRDEHKGNWGNVDPHATGLWTKGLTRKSIYDAMRHRRTYSSADRNFELAFSANGCFMGSILPGATNELHMHIMLHDPDPTDLIDRVLIYTNQGQIVKEYRQIGSPAFAIEDTLPCQDGDYFFIRVFQEDGDEMISAPVWVGETTRGTRFAPEIELYGQLPESVRLGEEVILPEAKATGDQGEAPEVNITVFNCKGEVPLIPHRAGGMRLQIEEYGDYFIKYSATDSNGNTRVELKRTVVDSRQLDADKILGEFTPLVNAGEREDVVGVNLVTDPVLQQAWVQYRPAQRESWNEASVVPATVSYFEAAYGDRVEESHFRLLAAHEAALSDLQQGTAYEYRYGLSADGPWGRTCTFETASHADGTVIYILGDLESPSNDGSDRFARFHHMLGVLQKKNDAGRLLVQLGNFVDQASHIHPWAARLEHVISRWRLISAHIAGESERYTRKERVETFKGFFHLPKNGVPSLRETNYSFDYGNTHVAIIDTLADLDEQFSWLEEDMQATKKKWKVVMGHRSYGGGKQSELSDKGEMGARLSKLFLEWGVHLYIGGQDHIAKRNRIQGTCGWEQVACEETLQAGLILQGNDTSLTLNICHMNGAENVVTCMAEDDQ